MTETTTVDRPQGGPIVKPADLTATFDFGGFEDYFREVAEAWGDLEAFARINERYELDMGFESVPGLVERFGLTFPSL